jgi:uncharacterized LabA/DUF88 family protein
MATIWMVDAAYLFNAAPGKFDYLKLKSALEKKNGQAFFESYYLNSTPNPPTDAQDAFHTWIKFSPPKGPKMRVQLYKLKDLHSECPKCHNEFDRKVQKGVDVGIATLVIKLAVQKKYDRLLLSAGDGDFEDAIQYVKDEFQKQIWLAGFKDSVSADLQSYSDNTIWIDDIWTSVEKP